MKKKIFLIIPDGVSLRNFLFTDFPEKAKEAGLEIVYWNATTYDIAAEGEREIKLEPKPKALTDLYKRAKINTELNYFIERFNDSVYEKYKFEPSSKGWKNKIKNRVVAHLISSHTGEKGLKILRERMRTSERKSAYYEECKKVLEREKPHLVFCASQRPVNAISPVTAAQDLGIPTACFIFSWDNLPKATKVIDTDYYFVWSDHMKRELLGYYPYIKPEQVKITGTPQFDIHKDQSVFLGKDEFFESYGLDKEKKYLCFSGDDITTSPHDECFLKDVAEEVEKLNERGNNLGIIFRRCPVDFSGRYDEVIKSYENLIVSIDPAWTNKGSYWNQSLPKKDDLILQTNIIEYSFMVINVGSSMVFDFAAKEKPCAYLNYLPSLMDFNKDIREVYTYTHFKSMPNKNSVYWINKKSDIPLIIEKALEDPGYVVSSVKEWLLKINNPHFGNISRRIVEQLDSI